MGWKRKLYKLVFAGPMQTVGHGVDADLQALLSFPCHFQPIFFANTSGDSSIPGTGPLSKFF